MTSLNFMSLGDKHKVFEKHFEQKLIAGVPVIARLDGRSFHTLTRKAIKPFDSGFIWAMEETAKYLVDEFSALVAYVQSDEITLVWNELNIFDGRVNKILTTLAATTSVVFAKHLSETELEHNVNVPTFDCRIWHIPSLDLAAENVMWRELDAYRNSINMAASSLFSHKSLQGMGTKQRLARLQEAGYDWHGLATRYKRGSIFKRAKILRELRQEELENIPVQFRPTGPVERSGIVRLELPILTSLTNPKEALFFGADPVKFEK
jgi:tRNA(His) 5'-end guanylyltransferase